MCVYWTFIIKEITGKKITFYYIYRQLFLRFFQVQFYRCFINDFEITRISVAMASDLRAENERDASNYMSLLHVAAFYTAGTPYVLEYIRRNANRYARELVRRARTRTHVLTLLRCSSV